MTINKSQKTGLLLNSQLNVWEARFFVLLFMFIFSISQIIPSALALNNNIQLNDIICSNIIDNQGQFEQDKNNGQQPICIFCPAISNNSASIMPVANASLSLLFIYENVNYSLLNSQTLTDNHIIASSRAPPKNYLNNHPPPIANHFPLVNFSLKGVFS